jgi:hypothetical protein
VLIEMLNYSIKFASNVKMLGEEAEIQKEIFRDRVTSLNFSRLPEIQQQNEINTALAEGLISVDDQDQMRFHIQKNLRVVSLNVGYNVMSNIKAGDEAPFVERCQTFYPRPPWGRPDLAGWYDINDNDAISNCAFNSAELLLNYNLFGLQGINPDFQREFIQAIKDGGRNDKKYRYLKNFEFHDNAHLGALANNRIITGYDRNVMGEGLLITPRNYSFGDPYNRGVLQATYFPLKNVLFINLHAPPDIDNLEAHLDLAFEGVRLNLIASWANVTFRNLRVIVTGDFNDCGGRLLDYSNSGKFKILGRPLRLHINPAQAERRVFALRTVERTCCFPDYRCYGDYIFDSLPVESKFYYFGLPIDYRREVDLYSNHDPVIMVELDDLTDKIVSGEIVRTADNFGQEHIGIAFKTLDSDMLYDIARLFLRNRHIAWPISKPRSWVRYRAFPHVSLDRATYGNLRGIIGTKAARVNVTLKELQYWPIEEDANGRPITDDQWVVVTVVIQGRFGCHRTCHMSIGQHHIPQIEEPDQQDEDD